MKGTGLEVLLRKESGWSSMSNDIKKILQYGVMAPSGDNSQPWFFKLKDNGSIDLIMDPDVDNPELNFKLSGTLMAHGALIENISLASKNFGYKCIVNLFPDTTNENIVANILFEKNNLEKSDLFNYIDKRHTNRKVYEKKYVISKEDEGYILNGIDNVNLISEKESKKKLSRVASYMEKIALETEKMHQLFFRDIFFDNEKNIRGDKGLYIKTLELPPPVQVLFKALKNWSFTTVLNKVGFSNFASLGNAKTYESSSAIGLIYLNNFDKYNLIDAGRKMQRIWLRVTKLDLSMQPITGITFLVERMLHNDVPNISNKNIKILNTAKEVLMDNSKGKHIALMFRIGKSKRPSDYSRRKSPIIV